MQEACKHSAAKATSSGRIISFTRRILVSSGVSSLALKLPRELLDFLMMCKQLEKMTFACKSTVALALSIWHYAY